LAGHEVWTVNSGGLSLRHDLVFDMHTEEYLYSQPYEQLNRLLGRRKWFETHDKPIMMPRALPQYPTSVTYPLKLVVESAKANYFTNSGAYMLALAYICGVQELLLFGWDYASTKKDGSQFVENGRACSEYWLGRLTEAGCTVVIPETSRLMESDIRSKGTISGNHLPLKVQILPNGEPKFIGPTPQDMGAPPPPELKLEISPKAKLIEDQSRSQAKLEVVSADY
jgi:hypothetical protein